MIYTNDTLSECGGKGACTLADKYNFYVRSI